MQITLHIEGDSNSADMAAVLAALAGQPVESDRSIAVPAPPKPAPAAAPAKVEKAKPVAAAKAEPEPVSTDAEQDDEQLMETAVERATGMINAGKADDLRAVLGKIGVKRVSELAGADLRQFIADTA